MTDRSRLEHARANGYLNAACRSGRRLARAHAFWCWRLRVPLIWFEPKSPHSRYGRLHLDLFPTVCTLTEEGQREMADLLRGLSVPGHVVVSPDDAHWEQVPRKRMEELARAVQRAASRLGNTEMRSRSRIATSTNVLPWRRVG